jgi:hypothetical protein
MLIWYNLWFFFFEWQYNLWLLIAYIMIGMIRFTESATYFIRDSIWSSYNFRKFKYSREEQQLIKYIYPLSFNCIIIFKFNFITLIFFFFIFFHIIISSIFFVGPHAVLSNSGSHQMIYVFHGFGIPNLDWLIKLHGDCYLHYLFIVFKHFHLLPINYVFFF